MKVPVRKKSFFVERQLWLCDQSGQSLCCRPLGCCSQRQTHLSRRMEFVYATQLSLNHCQFMEVFSLIVDISDGDTPIESVHVGIRKCGCQKPKLLFCLQTNTGIRSLKAWLCSQLQTEFLQKLVSVQCWNNLLLFGGQSKYACMQWFWSLQMLLSEAPLKSTNLVSSSRIGSGLYCCQAAVCLIRGTNSLMSR